jgi:hypothetical protein
MGDCNTTVQRRSFSNKILCYTVGRLDCDASMAVFKISCTARCRQSRSENMLGYLTPEYGQTMEQTHSVNWQTCQLKLLSYFLDNVSSSYYLRRLYSIFCCQSLVSSFELKKSFEVLLLHAFKHYHCSISDHHF